MARSFIWCAWCNARVEKENGAINRARSAGLWLYCGRVCSGLGRRDPSPRTDAQRRADKADYDRQYRDTNRPALKAKKAAYFKATYDPARAAVERKANMPRHVEYCRRPAYRQKKAAYDKRRLAAQQYGPFAEAALLVRDLECRIAEHADRYEIYRQNGTLNKALQRKRAL